VTLDERAIRHFCSRQTLRLLQLAAMRQIPTCSEIMAAFHISRATAKRDIAAVRRFKHFVASA
jgi:predicted DNA-binding transcriptional regulator YafY